MRISILVSTIFALSTSPLCAQERDRREDSPTDEPEIAGTAPTVAPIVVTADDEEEAPKVILGSRIPRKQTVHFEGIATSTGTRGLTPQSGMDPAEGLRILRITKCSSDDPAVGVKASCLLIRAEQAIEQEDYTQARDLLAYLALTDSFSPKERLAGAEWQYRLAADLGDEASREIALQQMLATGAMTEGDAISARRTLVSLALKSGDRALARQRLIDLDARGEIDAQRLANLAILTRELGEGDGKAEMRRAIELRTGKGADAPKGWIDFADN